MKLSLQEIFEHVNGNPGQRHTSAQVANHFNTRVQETTPLLRELVAIGKLKSSMSMKKSVFFTLSQAEILVANQVQAVQPFKPLSGYDALMRRIANSAEAGR